MCEIPILVWVIGNYVCCTVNNAAKDVGNVNSSGECVLPTTEPMQDASPYESGLSDQVSDRTDQKCRHPWFAGEILASN
ncbi:hypothetical protein N7494_012868 [Penicillium frequentans]|uniref:Uncharacterized protein n=1 Tax=Penicillium frequentans TaxID=3151616 RepID=A0AAD6GB04_9EURO|nr:hypothetical protein N7494_012868 [Penicillium glabrum]